MKHTSMKLSVNNLKVPKISHTNKYINCSGTFTTQEKSQVHSCFLYKMAGAQNATDKFCRKQLSFYASIYYEIQYTNQHKQQKTKWPFK